MPSPPQITLITGGSSGLGLAMAAGMASAGANIVIVNRNHVEGTDAAEELAKAYGTRVIAINADVTQEEQMEAMAKQLDQWQMSGQDVNIITMIILQSICNVK